MTGNSTSLKPEINNWLDLVNATLLENFYNLLLKAVVNKAPVWIQLRYAKR